MVLLDSFTHDGEYIEIRLHDAGDRFEIKVQRPDGSAVNGYRYSTSKLNPIDARMAGSLEPIRILVRIARHDVETGQWARYVAAISAATR